MVAEENLARYLEKWQETAQWALSFFEKQSESYAAQHLNDKVYYSPICNRLAEMLGDIRIMQAGTKAIDQSG
jgi:hypothetical protein